MPSRMSLLLVCWLPCVCSANEDWEPQPRRAVKPPGTNEPSMRTLEGLAHSRNRADVRRLVAVQLQLQKRIPAQQLAPHFVPLLFHPASRVRQVADRVVRRSGPKGNVVAIVAFHDQRAMRGDDRDVRLVLREVYQDYDNDLVPALLERFYNDRERYSAKVRRAIVRRLVAHRVTSPPAQRIYRMAIESGASLVNRERSFVDIERIRRDPGVWSLLIPTKEVTDRILIPKLESNQIAMICEALLALRRHTNPPRELINKISRRLSHPSNDVFAYAVSCLHGCANWEDVRPAFRDLSRSKSAKLRRRALKMLIRFNPDTATTVNAIRSALPVESDEAMRLYLLSQLKRIAPDAPATIRSLTAVVSHDRSRKVRLAALKSLAAVRAKARSSSKELTTVLERETDYELRLEIARSLQQVYPRDSKLQPVLKKIEGELTFHRTMELMQSILRQQEQLIRDTRRLNVESILGDVKQK